MPITYSNQRRWPTEVSNFWKAYDTFIFDGDGVLWTGQNVIDGASELIKRIIDDGKNVFILTNNSNGSQNELVQKCIKLGFTGIKKDNIVTSGIVCAHELLKMKKMAEFSNTANLPIYLLGSNGFKNVLNEAGIECFGCGPDPVENYTKDTFVLSVDLSQKPFAVVAAFDPHINYVKVMKAVNYLKDENIPFIVTNEDLTFPGPNPDIIIPGAGITSTVLKAVSGRIPIVMGKPNIAIWNYICESFEGQINSKRTMMIGDRCDTDILFGNRNGLDTLLVLSGVSSLYDVEKFENEGKNDHVPKYVMNSLKDLIDNVSFS